MQLIARDWPRDPQLVLSGESRAQGFPTQISLRRRSYGFVATSCTPLLIKAGQSRCSRPKRP